MTEPVKRASDIEEFSNRWLIHPVSSALVPIFARLGISPNGVSIAGMTFGAAAGFFYAHYAVRPAWCFIGFALMLVWHICDGADGQLARLTGKQSELGKIIDGICDYVVFIGVYLGITYGASHHHGAWVWAVMVVAGALHAIQAGSYETQRQMFDYWALGKTSAAMPDPDIAPGPRFISRLAHGYGRMQFRFSGLTRGYYRALQSFASEHAQAMPRMRAAYRAHFVRSVHLWSIMCANYRTLGVFLACVLGEPLLFFAWEIGVLGIVHLILAMQQRQRNWHFRATQLQ